MSIVAQVEIKELPPGSMMNLHHKLGSKKIHGEEVRFCQHINGACSWLSVDDDLYQIDTEELMNAMLNAVMEHRQVLEDLQKSIPEQFDLNRS